MSIVEQYNRELYHYGVKGMKWGVRRYQNKDGSLTPAGQKRLSKDLKKDYKHNYQSTMPYKTSVSFRDKVTSEVSKVITDDDKKRIINAKNRYFDSIKESVKAERALDKLAKKYGNEYYEEELRRNPNAYDTKRSKEKLKEFSIVEYGYNKAQESRPDLAKAVESDFDTFESYLEECRKVGDKLLGKYGNAKLHESKYTSLTLRDKVGDIVSSIESTGEWER